MTMATLVKLLHNRSPIEELQGPELAVPTHEPSAPTLLAHSSDLSSDIYALSSNESAENIKLFNTNDLSQAYTRLGPVQEELSQHEGNIDHITSAGSLNQRNVGTSTKLKMPFSGPMDQYKASNLGKRINFKPWNWKLTSYIPSTPPKATNLGRHLLGSAECSSTRLDQQDQSYQLGPANNILREHQNLDPNKPKAVVKGITEPARANGMITSSISSAIIPVSVEFSGTPMEAEVLTLPQGSPRIFCWSEEEGLYVGNVKDTPVPSSIQVQWISIRPRLIRDLRLVVQSLPRSLSREKTIVEPEICMAGKIDVKTGKVELKPAVWIRCGSRRCQKAITQAVEDLGYLQAFSRGPVRVHRKAPRFAANSTRISPQDRGPLASPSLQILFSEIGSACGATISFSFPNGSLSKRTSTLGGLIRVDNKIYGLTTAHAIVDLLPDDFGNNLYDDSDAESISSRSSSCSSLENTEHDRRLRLQSENNTLYLKKPFMPSMPSSSRPPSSTCATLGPFHYSGFGNQLNEGISLSESEGCDFALIDIDPDRSPLLNFYKSHPITSEVVAQTYVVGEFFPETELDRAGPVSIICPPDDVIDGELLEGTWQFFDRATVFTTEKIQTKSPLGKKCWI